MERVARRHRRRQPHRRHLRLVAPRRRAARPHRRHRGSGRARLDSRRQPVAHDVVSGGRVYGPSCVRRMERPPARYGLELLTAGIEADGMVAVTAPDAHWAREPGQSRPLRIRSVNDMLCAGALKRLDIPSKLGSGRGRNRRRRSRVGRTATERHDLPQAQSRAREPRFRPDAAEILDLITLVMGSKRPRPGSLAF